MEKPEFLKVKEFETKMEDAINNANLPWWIIKREFECIYLPQIRTFAKMEEDEMIQRYNEETEKESENNG